MDHQSLSERMEAPVLNADRQATFCSSRHPSRLFWMASIKEVAIEISPPFNCWLTELNMVRDCALAACLSRCNLYGGPLIAAGRRSMVRIV